MNDTFYCLVVGSRSFNDFKLLTETLDRLLCRYTDIVIVSGGAKGADTLAASYAAAHGYAVKVFPAEWDKYGNRAGYIRNEEMHKYISAFPLRGCVAFWDGVSKGTAHSFELAKQYNNPLRIIRF